MQQDKRQVGLTNAPQSSRRVALVIGNGAYQNIRKLKNPANDAADMAAIEREAWLLVRNSNDAEDFREFLAAYPNGNTRRGLGRREITRGRWMKWGGMIKTLGVGRIRWE